MGRFEREQGSVQPRLRPIGSLTAALALWGCTVAGPCLAFADEGVAPALRLGHLGQDFVSERQCFPADAMFQIAFNESGNVYYLIARADCYAATGSEDLAREGFAWAAENEGAARASERSYIERTLARLTSAPQPDAAEVVAAHEPPALREPNGYLYASSLYRMNDTFTPPVPMADLNEPHIGAELGWYPLRGIVDDIPDIGLFVRAYGAVETDGVKMDDDSLQGGVGLRLEPFDGLDLTLRGEWLFPIGTNAREGWMFSAAHEWGVGGDWRGMAAPWIVATSSLNGAWLPERDGFSEYVSGRAETTLGFALPLTERVALIPHGVAAMRYSEDDTDHNALGEAGLGLDLRFWYGDRNQGTIDIIGQYRWFVLDDTTLPLSEDGTWMGRVVVSR